MSCFVRWILGATVFQVQILLYMLVALFLCCSNLAPAEMKCTAVPQTRWNISLGENATDVYIDIITTSILFSSHSLSFWTRVHQRNQSYFTLLHDWENHVTVIGWEQVNLSQLLICSAVQLNAHAFAIFVSHLINESLDESSSNWVFTLLVILGNSFWLHSLKGPCNFKRIFKYHS